MACLVEPIPSFLNMVVQQRICIGLPPLEPDILVVIRQLALPVKAGKKAAALLIHTARIPKRHDIVQYMAEVIFRKLL